MNKKRRDSYVELVCPECSHAEVEHCEGCAMPGCQVDLITPDGPENCGCMRFDSFVPKKRPR